MKLWKLVVMAVALAGNQAAVAEESANAQPLMERDQVTGDWAGARPLLSDRGVEIFGGYTVEVWGNTAGGLKTGSVYTGLLDFGGRLDLEKIMGWRGASISTTWLWLSGRDASEDLVGNFLTVSNIAGFNTLRMFEAWFQQNLLDDRISVRLGQLAADSEFLISDYSGLFINGTFGWPASASMNIPEGGPHPDEGRRHGRNRIRIFTTQQWCPQLTRGRRLQFNRRGDGHRTHLPGACHPLARRPAGSAIHHQPGRSNRPQQRVCCRGPRIGDILT